MGHNSKIILVGFRKFLIESKVTCFIVSRLVVVSIMNCKFLCLSVSKTNIVSALVPSDQGSTYCSPIMLPSAKLFIIILAAHVQIEHIYDLCFWG